MSSAKRKALLCILTASAFTLASPVQAFGFQDFLKSVEENLPESLQDSIPESLEIIQDYLPDSLDGVDIDFDTIQKAIIKFMNSPWYSGASKEERIEEITHILELFGIDNAKIIAENVDTILSFSFQGQDIGIYIENYTTELFDPSKWEAPEDLNPVIDADEELNKNAVIMYGLEFEEIESFLTELADTWTSYGLNTRIDNNCTVDDFKTELKNNDLIVIGEHGSCDYGIPMICTTEHYSKASAARYADDISNDRICCIITDEGVYYWLCPSFFTYYYGDGSLSDSLVWISSCSGFKSDELANAFISCGAGAVIGHSETVYCAYDCDLLNCTIADMIDGNSSANALSFAMEICGDNDISYARNVMRLSSEEIKDCTSYPRTVGSVDWFEGKEHGSLEERFPALFD